MASRGYSRAKYQAMIWQYEKRRQVYRRAMVNATNKIQAWKKMIKKIDERNQQIRNAAYLINQYFNVRMKSKKSDEKSLIARRVFYKYGIEELGMKGRWLSEYLGYTHRNTATSSRRFFTKSFIKKPKNKKAYYEVREYLKNNKENISEKEEKSQMAE